MAHFSESLCEEVIRTEGKCGLTRNEMTQMARFALRAIRAENPLLVDAARYRWLRSEEVATDPRYYAFWNEFNAKLCREEQMDAAIDAAMSGAVLFASASTT
jgi:hypothetical protein